MTFADPAMADSSEPQQELAGPTCTAIPFGSDNPAVEVCEYEKAYTFTVVGELYKYEKKVYQNRMQEMLIHWLDQSNLPSEYWRDATVDMWLAVPEANPGATQARFAVSGSSGSFVLFSSIHPEEWDLTNDNVGILLDGPYPESYGVTAGEILVQKKDSTSEDTLFRYMERLGGYSPEGFSRNWYNFQSVVFDEERIRERVENSFEGRFIVDAVQRNSIYEWIAQREKVVSFKLFP